MLKLLTLSILIILSTSCSKGLLNGDNQKNLEQLDQTYGKCDNPFRQYTKAQYRICKDKERAAGPDGVVDDPISITDESIIVEAFTQEDDFTQRITASLNRFNGKLLVRYDGYFEDYGNSIFSDLHFCSLTPGEQQF